MSMFNLAINHIISIFISIPKQTSKSESNNKAHVWYSKNQNGNGGEGWKAKKAQ